MLIIEGSEHSDRLVVVAPGDLGLVTDPGPLRLATSMIAAGYRVIRFAAPRPLIEDAMAADRALADVIRQASEEASPGQGLVLVGFSRGARVAAALTAADHRAEGPPAGEGRRYGRAAHAAESGTGGAKF